MDLNVVVANIYAKTTERGIKEVNFMRLTVYKYTLLPLDSQTFRIPGFQKFLSLQVQRGKPCLWATVDADAPVVDVEVFTIGTGCRFDKGPEWKYCGTFQIEDESLVFHTYYKVEESHGRGQQAD